MIIQESLTRGSIDIALLHLLTDRDMYGYELINELKKRSDNNLSVKEGSIYPVMYRMIERGIVTERAVLAGKRRTRKYYHLTDEGWKYYTAIREEYLKFTKAMDTILNYKEESTKDRNPNIELTVGG